MNEIEIRFFDQFNKVLERYRKDQDYVDTFPCYIYFLKPQVAIGIYKVDFLYHEDCVIEIDGHENHKTKEQREYDYTRERYLMKKGYKVIRFMGTEVFLDPHKCVMEMIEIGGSFQRQHDEVWEKGFKRGRDHNDHQD